MLLENYLQRLVPAIHHHKKKKKKSVWPVWLFIMGVDLAASCVCRCESCHGQAERLLDSAKEMEDSIAVNLRFECCSVVCCHVLQRISEQKRKEKLVNSWSSDLLFSQSTPILTSFISSRRLEVSRVELLLQVGTFCVALGALVAGMSCYICIYSTSVTCNTSASGFYNNAYEVLYFSSESGSSLYHLGTCHVLQCP